MVLNPIEIEKTSKVVTGDSKMVDLKPARLEVYNAKLSDFLGEIKRNNKYQKRNPTPAKDEKQNVSSFIFSQRNELEVKILFLAGASKSVLS